MQTRFPLIVFCALIISLNSCGQISKENLIDDVNQLKEFIEVVHPDPYYHGGGKVAFNKRYQDIIKAIPENGMNKEDFYVLVTPLVASVNDGHTWMRPAFSDNPYSPGGIPLYFGIVEEGLFVLAVPNNNLEHFIGYKLISVEGLSLNELVERCNKFMGADNNYLLLRNLAGTGKLWYRSDLQALIPKWQNKKKIRVTLQSLSGDTEEHILDIPGSIKYPLITKGSKFKLPSREKCDFVYTFLDDKKETALLVIDGMMSYREAFEMWISFGNGDAVNDAKDVYKRYNGQKAPKDTAGILKGVPSATEIFKNLVIEMKEAGTKNLLVDLRRNDGGNSFMYNILIYYMYGKEKLLEIKQYRYEIEKYSSVYFERNPNVKLSDLNNDNQIVLSEEDYNFESKYRTTKELISEEFHQEVALTQTFQNELESGYYNNYYLPENILVICGPKTFSSGYTMMYYLYRAGAEIVGTPSSQAGNCYGDVLSFKLKNSGLSGNVSHKQFLYFPEDKALGKILTPHYQITYDKIKSCNFDLNSEILYALELLKAR